MVDAQLAGSQLSEALLLLAGAVALAVLWFSLRRRDRRATEALRASEERFRHLTLLSADWFWWDPLESTCRHASLSIL